MSKNTNDLDLVTFQPFGEETLMHNEVELKKATDSNKDNVQGEIKQLNKSKGDKFNGLIIGLLIAALFIAYDVFIRR